MTNYTLRTTRKYHRPTQWHNFSTIYCHVTKWLWTGFGLAIGFIAHLYSEMQVTIALSLIDTLNKSLQLSIILLSLLQPPLVVAWQQIPTMFSASVLMSLPAGCSPRVRAACELHSLTAGSRLASKQASSSLLLVFSSMVILGVEPHRDPWPYFCSHISQLPLVI
jgi:hypothetical protein